MQLKSNLFQLVIQRPSGVVPRQKVYFLINSRYWIGGISTVLFWLLTGIVPPVTANEVVNNDIAQSSSDPVIFEFPQNFTPPGDGRPDTTRGSGARSGSCMESSQLELESATNSETSTNSEISLAEQTIQVLAPPGNYALTFEEYPTIFVNFNGSHAPLVVLKFETETGEYSERVNLPVDPEQPIQGFTLPSDRPSLEIGKNYRWTILIACDGEVNPLHPIFTGWVQRVEQTPEQATLLNEQSIPEQIVWYAEQGYWYDMVMALHQGLHDNPSEPTLEELWRHMTNLAVEPMLIDR